MVRHFEKSRKGRANARHCHQWGPAFGIAISGDRHSSLLLGSFSKQHTLSFWSKMEVKKKKMCPNASFLFQLL